jgi:hypothetical protein
MLSNGITLDGNGTKVTNAITGYALITNNLHAPTITNGLTGFEFYDGSGGWPWGVIQVNGNETNGSYFRIYGNVFSGFNEFQIFVMGAIGVVSSNRFRPAGTGIPIYVFHQGWGGKEYSAGSWAGATGWNTDKWVFIEDNEFYWESQFYAVIDSYRGARWVFRYNDVTNGWCEAHGTESSQIYRGTRAIQVYENTFVKEEAYAVGSFDKFVNIRSGTALVFSNNAIGNFVAAAVATAYRGIDSFVPFGGADGTNEWDNNAPGGPFATGTHTGVDGATTLTDSTKSWTPGQWTNSGYVLKNTTRNRFSTITGNAATTISYSAGFQTTMVWTNGDSYQIWRVIESLDQAGVGGENGEGALMNRSMSGATIPVGCRQGSVISDQVSTLQTWRRWVSHHTRIRTRW